MAIVGLGIIVIVIIIIAVIAWVANDPKNQK